MRKMLTLFLALLLAFGLVACGSEDGGSGEPSDAAAEEPAGDCEEGVVETGSGLQYEELECGDGQEAKRGDTVVVHYTGTLEDGTKFDSSLDRGQPFPFTIGAGQVIQGWEEGIAGMKIGGKRKLTIPPELAYGKAGRPPVIPKSATLIFEVTLVDIQ
jgi:peptidylprolyl isomerase